MTYGFVRKFSDSKRFKPHFNSAMGKYIQTKDDYLKEMKRGNYEPYDSKLNGKPHIDYKPSEWQKDMIRHVIHVTDKDGKAHVSSTWRKELERRGGTLVNHEKYRPRPIINLSQGGFSGAGKVRGSKTSICYR